MIDQKAPDDPAQSERFIQIAEIDDSSDVSAFDSAMEAILKKKKNKPEKVEDNKKAPPVS